eukprot:jgi/Tetstr1/425902/TSEL_016273.t1
MMDRLGQMLSGVVPQWARHARRALIIHMVAAVATVVMAVEEATAGARCLAYGFGAARALDQMRRLVLKLVEKFSVRHPV